MVLDTEGNLYGTTQHGGSEGQGTVFELVPTPNGGWQEFVIHSFALSGDGAQPVAGLIFDAEGSLYGTTEVGGLNQCGCGTVFKLSPSGGAWKETILYSFTDTNGDGALPTTSLVFDDAGNLYGTTSIGGGGYECQGYCGTAFQLSPVKGGWAETVLHAFDGSDGAYPTGGLVFDHEGNLYGVTYEGGTASYCGIGLTSCGIVFELTRLNGGNIWTETILYDFGSHPGDATYPLSGLTFDGAGNLYGTSAGGAKRWGTVFKVSPGSDGKWRESVVHTFAGYPVDGGAPDAGVIFAPDGNLYGTTETGGTGGGGGYGGIRYFGGTVFEITP